MTIFASLVLIAFAYFIGLIIGRHQNDMLHAKVVTNLGKLDPEIAIKYSNELLQVVLNERKK